MRNMIRFFLAIIFISAYIGMEAFGDENYINPISSDMYKSPVYQGVYGDTSPIIVPQPVSIDLTKQSSILPKREGDKSISTDFGQFLKTSLAPYSWNWLERLIIAPHNVKVVFTDTPGQFFDNISHWQDCKVGFCHPLDQRAPFWAPPLNDGDYFKTNYVEHPLSGAATFLYYRAMGYNRVSSFFGSFVQSIVFEYTIEGFQQPPSFNDIIATPVLGSALGIVVDESSNWLAHRDSQFLRALSFIVNPFRILNVEHEASLQNFGGVSFRFNL